MKVGLYIAFTAMFLQLAVFLQPLLPAKYEFAPVCDTIAEILPDRHLYSNDQEIRSLAAHQDHLMLNEHSQHSMHDMQGMDHSKNNENQHHLEHDCMFCSVFSHIVNVENLGVRQVLERVQVFLLFLTKLFKSFYFALQQLFLLPQNRAPPILFSA